MRLVYFVNQSTKNISTPVFIPDEGEKDFSLRRFIFAVITSNYCAMKDIKDGAKEFLDFGKSEDFYNYGLQFLSDNNIHVIDMGDSFDIINQQFPAFKLDVDNDNCSKHLRSSEFKELIELSYSVAEKVVNSIKGGEEDERRDK